MKHVLCAVLLAVAAPRLYAQAGAPAAGVTQAAMRARAMANEGNGVKARELLDSLVAAQPGESIDEAEALYWRAILSETADDAERDWKRLIVDVPFSPRAGDALLHLAELDLTRSNTALARQRVQRLLLDHPDAPERPRALLVLARTYFGENDSPRACGVLTVVRKEAPLSAVEVRLQADELQQQCRNVHEVAMDAAPAATTTPTTLPVTAAPPVVPPIASATKPPAAGKVVAPPVLAPPVIASPVVAPPVVAPPATVPPVNAPPISNNGDSAVFKVVPHPSRVPVAVTPPATARWTIRIASYPTRLQADAQVRRLAARHITAHTAGTRKPFRVEAGRYATRAEAAGALAKLRKKGQKGFVAEAGTP